MTTLEIAPLTSARVLHSGGDQGRTYRVEVKTTVEPAWRHVITTPDETAAYVLRNMLEATESVPAPPTHRAIVVSGSFPDLDTIHDTFYRVECSCGLISCETPWRPDAVTSARQHMEHRPVKLTTDYHTPGFVANR